MADGRRVTQVMVNLLTNAARYCHEASPIYVEATADRSDGGVMVSVTDNGQGLTADSLPHLFAKFSRPAGVDQRRDLGLGLAICKGIVEAHGGRIWAESDGPGLGSRFTFTLPAADEAATAAATAAAHSSAAGATRILAIDDNPRDLKHIRDTLTAAGYDTTVTGNPARIAALVADTDPHIVLLDLMLPGADGFDVMRDILAARDVAVIFLSAYGQHDLIAKALQMGAADYIVKPFSPTELTARIQAALRNKNQPTALPATTPAAPAQAPLKIGDLRHRPPRPPRHRSRPTRRSHPHRIPPPSRTRRQRRHGPHPRPAPHHSLEHPQPNRSRPNAHRHQERPPQTRRRRPQPALHRHSPPRRLPHAQTRPHQPPNTTLSPLFVAAEMRPRTRRAVSGLCAQMGASTASTCAEVISLTRTEAIRA